MTYTHTKKLIMHIYWFSSESGYRRWKRRWQRRMPQYNHLGNISPIKSITTKSRNTKMAYA